MQAGFIFAGTELIGDPWGHR